MSAERVGGGMDTTQLGPFTVSRLCLGTMLMGSKTPVEESHRMLDRFLDAGGNFLDTADTYDDGGSEETLAPWLAAAATRSCSPPRCASRSPTPAARASRPTASAPPATRACAGSASTRSTSTRCTRPIPRCRWRTTLEALDGLVRAGKVRALGASNFPAWLLAWAVALQDRHGLVAVRLAAAAVLAGRALDRGRDPAVLPRRRARRDPVGPARRRLPDRPLLARRAAAAGLAHGRRRRRHRGGAGAARDRAQLPRRRRGARDRRRRRARRSRRSRWRGCWASRA